jgi:cell division protein FtsL
MSSSDEYHVRVPSTLTLRDLIYIAIAIISITTSFLLHGTRISVIEQQMLTVGNNITEIKQDIKQIIRDEREEDAGIKQLIDDLTDRQRELEADQSRIEWYLNKEDDNEG